MTEKKTPSQKEVRRIMRSETPRAKKLIWRPIIAGLLLLILLICGVSYAYLRSATNEILVNHSAKDKAKIQKGRPISVLIMGTDVGALGRNDAYVGNTDTMELLTINPTDGSSVITAIPRDTLVKITTKKGSIYEKINAAYALGGPKLAKKTVNELLAVPVNYYALVNMGTLKKVVDAVGGVEVDNSFAFKFDGHQYPKGRQKLNGKEALGYARMRYQDPDNDYGRQRRGQQVLTSAIKKFRDKGNLLAVHQIVMAIKDGVRTDVPLDDLRTLYQNYAPAMNSTQQEQLRGKDAMIDGAAFQIATPQAINEVSKQVRHSMGLEPIKVNNEETKLVKAQTTWNGYNQIEFTLPNGAQYNKWQK
ncbi:LCP family protein [Lactobacillus sp. HT06-2]|uniref:LCP family protein n=1 Tax=Lactobacillus sp. HT06-2 TaxID=2080222 RepID=UPI000CD8B5FC|nr:LCP family protein [Lactobacillus sp. HT06-2]